MFWEGKEKKMKTSLADVHFSLVRPWEDREKAQELVPKNRRRKDWNESIDLAEEMVLLTPGRLVRQLIGLHCMLIAGVSARYLTGV